MINNKTLAQNHKEFPSIVIINFINFIFLMMFLLFFYDNYSDINTKPIVLLFYMFVLLTYSFSLIMAIKYA